MHDHPKSLSRILFLLAAVVCLGQPVRAAVPPAEKLLPDDTLVLFTVPNFAKAQDVFKHSPHGQLWQDPSLKAFRDKFVDKLNDAYITPLEHDLGVHLADYANLPQGQLIFAMTQNGWTGGDPAAQPGLLLLVDTKDKSPQLRTNLADLKKKWLDAGKKVRSEKIRDVEFSIIALSTNDLPKTLRKPDAPPRSPDLPEPLENPDAKKFADKNELYIGQTDTLLVVGNSAKLIEKVLARMGGGEVRTVGDLPEFDASAALFRDATFFGWVNARALVNILLRPDDSSGDSDLNPLGFQTDKLVAALGLKAVKQVAFSFRDNDEGALGTLFIGVPEPDRAGLFKILPNEGKECGPPSFVPADAVKFSRVRIDGQKTWATLKQIINDVNPQALNELNLALTMAESAAKEKNPDFDINKGLFGNLGDDVITYSKVPSGDSLTDLSSGPELFLVGSPNPEQLVAGLRSLMVFFGQAGPPTEREFLGRKIYSLPLPSMPMPAPGPKDAKVEPRSLSYAFGGGYVAITTDTGMLEEYLRSSQNEGKSLRDAPGLADAMQKVAGSGTGIFGYSNDRETMRVTLGAFKNDFAAALYQNPLGPVAAALGVGSDTKLKEWFDASLLPDFAQISKYFSFSVYAETATPDGIVFKSFTPTPPQLKK